MLEMEGTNQRKTGHLRSMMSMSHPALGPAWPLRVRRNHGRNGTTLATLHCDASFTSFSSLLGCRHHEGRGCVCRILPRLQQSPNTTNSEDFCWRNGRGLQFLVLTFSNCGYSLNTSADHRPCCAACYSLPFLSPSCYEELRTMHSWWASFSSTEYDLTT